MSENKKDIPDEVAKLFEDQKSRLNEVYKQEKIIKKEDYTNDSWDLYSQELITINKLPIKTSEEIKNKINALINNRSNLVKLEDPNKKDLGNNNNESDDSSEDLLKYFISGYNSVTNVLLSQIGGSYRSIILTKEEAGGKGFLILSDPISKNKDRANFDINKAVLILNKLSKVQIDQHINDISNADYKEVYEDYARTINFKDLDRTILRSKADLLKINSGGLDSISMSFETLYNYLGSTNIPIYIGSLKYINMVNFSNAVGTFNNIQVKQAILKTKSPNIEFVESSKKDSVEAFRGLNSTKLIEIQGCEDTTLDGISAFCVDNDLKVFESHLSSNKTPLLCFSKGYSIERFSNSISVSNSVFANNSDLLNSFHTAYELIKRNLLFNTLITVSSNILLKESERKSANFFRVQNQNLKAVLNEERDEEIDEVSRNEIMRNIALNQRRIIEDLTKEDVISPKERIYAQSLIVINKVALRDKLYILVRDSEYGELIKDSIDDIVFNSLIKDNLKSETIGSQCNFESEIYKRRFNYEYDLKVEGLVNECYKAITRSFKNNPITEKSFTMGINLAKIVKDITIDQIINKNGDPLEIDDIKLKIKQSNKGSSKIKEVLNKNGDTIGYVQTIQLPNDSQSTIPITNNSLKSVVSKTGTFLLVNLKKIIESGYQAFDDKDFSKVIYDGSDTFVIDFQNKNYHSFLINFRHFIEANNFIWNENYKLAERPTLNLKGLIELVSYIESRRIISHELFSSKKEELSLTKSLIKDLDINGTTPEAIKNNNNKIREFIKIAGNRYNKDLDNLVSPILNTFLVGEKGSSIITSKKSTIDKNEELQLSLCLEWIEYTNAFSNFIESEHIEYYDSLSELSKLNILFTKFLSNLSLESFGLPHIYNIEDELSLGFKIGIGNLKLYEACGIISSEKAVFIQNKIENYYEHIANEVLEIQLAKVKQAIELEEDDLLDYDEDDEDDEEIEIESK